MPQPDDPRSDDDLLAAYATGDATAAAPLAARHAPRILAVATRMLADRAEAEDVTQDTLLRLSCLDRGWAAQAALTTRLREQRFCFK